MTVDDWSARLGEVAAGFGRALGDGEAEALAGLPDRVAGILRPPGGSEGAARGGGPRGLAGAVALDPASLDGATAHRPEPDDSPWVWRSSETAGQPSARAGQAHADGPLAGWRLAVKDVIAIAGQPLFAGSAACLDAAAQPVDASVVAALRAAGARVAGTTKLHEFAFGTTGVNAAFGTPVNPAAPGRAPGGSSSGAGAVIAAGEADLALGTDTGGSVRIPAALCGVVGYKPSFGAISTEGVWPLSPSLDHVGLLTADVASLLAPARVLGLIDGDPGGGPRRFGLARGALAPASIEVAAGFGGVVEALVRAGHQVVEVDWPLGDEVFAATTAIMFVEAAWVHRELLAARGDRYGADVRARLLQGAVLDLDVYLRARAAQRRLRERCLAALGGLDAVLTPTVPIEPPPLESCSDAAVGATLVTFTRLADLTGLPAISVPVADAPLPVGVQIEAGSQAAALAAALAVEAAQPRR